MRLGLSLPYISLPYLGGQEEGRKWKRERGGSGKEKEMGRGVGRKERKKQKVIVWECVCDKVIHSSQMWFKARPKGGKILDLDFKNIWEKCEKTLVHVISLIKVCTSL